MLPLLRWEHELVFLDEHKASFEALRTSTINSLRHKITNATTEGLKTALPKFRWSPLRRSLSIPNRDSINKDNMEETATNLYSLAMNLARELNRKKSDDVLR